MNKSVMAVLSAVGMAAAIFGAVKAVQFVIWLGDCSRPFPYRDNITLCLFFGIAYGVSFVLMLAVLFACLCVLVVGIHTIVLALTSRRQG